MKKILTISVFIVLPLVAHAAEKSVWVEINGEAYMGVTYGLKCGNIGRPCYVRV
jgi:hypothetical protein